MGAIILLMLRARSSDEGGSQPIEPLPTLPNSSLPTAPTSTTVVPTAPAAQQPADSAPVLTASTPQAPTTVAVPPTDPPQTFPRPEVKVTPIDGSMPETVREIRCQDRQLVLVFDPPTGPFPIVYIVDDGRWLQDNRTFAHEGDLHGELLIHRDLEVEPGESVATRQVLFFEPGTDPEKSDPLVVFGTDACDQNLV
jgi:hypothetical protein